MNTTRLKPIQQVASGREDRALDEFLASQKKLAEAQTRLQELCDYLTGYEQPGTEISSMMLVNRQAFLERLRTAIDFQSRQVAQAEAALQVERARWLLASRDVRVLDKLAECYRGRERTAADRVEQREQDDRACFDKSRPVR